MTAPEANQECPSPVKAPSRQGAKISPPEFCCGWWELQIHGSPCSEKKQKSSGA
jgi:hypothetical protein